MLDIRRIRTELDLVKKAVSRRGEDTAPLDEAFDLDRRQRELADQRDRLRNEIGGLSKQVGQLHREGRKDDAVALQERSRALGDDEKRIAAQTDDLAQRLRDVLLMIPNMPADDCPDGTGEHDNVVLRTHGFDPANYGEHQRRAHWDIGAELGILDIERGTKLSGSMFVMYRGFGATLVRALLQFALDRNADAYEEIRPPTLVKTETMISTGHLPKFADEAYHLERDDLWAIPTAEVPLTSLARDEVLDEANLPMRLMAHTSCFRREAGSAGRDTRGLLRVHEFDKVEILAYATPQQAPSMHEEILQRAESLIRDLGLAYRILDLCTGDIGGASKRTWDIEVYAPGVDRWLECSSVSWFGDYQARRANIRYRPADQKGTQVVHTLNGSALAVPRVWAALVETHRQPDGSIVMPEALHPYLRGVQRFVPSVR
ncbi:MAG: serine--tRNA ligase [Acidimicrobiales bacterium]